MPPDDANELLRELLEESKSFEKITFKLFDNVVSSPHTSSFYVQNLDEVNRQRLEYVYNGSSLTVGQLGAAKSPRPDFLQNHSSLYATDVDAA